MREGFVVVLFSLRCSANNSLKNVYLLWHDKPWQIYVFYFLENCNSKNQFNKKRSFLRDECAGAYLFYSLSLLLRLPIYDIVWFIEA